MSTTLHGFSPVRDIYGFLFSTPPCKGSQANGGGGGGPTQPAFDVPMYCLEAPSRPLCRTTSSRTGFRYGSTNGPTAPQYDAGYDDDYWCTLAVPLYPDNVGEGEYRLEWAAMTLVVQPHFKFWSTAGPQQPSPALAAAGPPATVSPGDVSEHGRDGGSGEGDQHVAAAAPVLIRTGGGSSRRLAAPDGATDAGTSRGLNAVSLTLVRTPSLGLRPSAPVPGMSPSGARNGRSSLTGRMGDLLSLFASVAGAGGGGNGGGGGGGDAGGAVDCEAGCGGAFGAGGDDGPIKPPRPTGPPPPPADGVPVAPGAPEPASFGDLDSEAGPSQRASDSPSCPLTGSSQDDGGPDRPDEEGSVAALLVSNPVYQGSARSALGPLGDATATAASGRPAPIRTVGQPRGSRGGDRTPSPRRQCSSERFGFAGGRRRSSGSANSGAGSPPRAGAVGGDARRAREVAMTGRK